jgi:hypothetical protein
LIAAHDHFGRRARRGECDLLSRQIRQRVIGAVRLHRPGELTDVIGHSHDDFEVEPLLGGKHDRIGRDFRKREIAGQHVA